MDVSNEDTEPLLANNVSILNEIEAISEIDVEQFTHSIRSMAVNFNLSLQSHNNLNVKDIFDIQNSIANILKQITFFLKNVVSLKVSSISSDLIETLSSVNDIFSYCSSEYKLNAYLEKTDLSVKTTQFVIDNEVH